MHDALSVKEKKENRDVVSFVRTKFSFTKAVTPNQSDLSISFGYACVAFILK